MKEDVQDIDEEFLVYFGNLVKIVIFYLGIFQIQILFRSLECYIFMYVCIVEDFCKFRIDEFDLNRYCDKIVGLER